MCFIVQINPILETFNAMAESQMFTDFTQQHILKQNTNELTTILKISTIRGKTQTGFRHPKRSVETLMTIGIS